MNLAILGSTGSIGVNALKVVRNLKSEFRIKALSAYSNIDLLQEQIKEFHPKYVCVGSEYVAKQLKKYYGNRIKIFFGNEGLSLLSSLSEVDLVLIAVVGAAGLYPLISAIKSKKRIALANKESVVIGGNLIRNLLRSGLRGIVFSSKKSFFIPIDSEHSAIFQCLKNEDINSVYKLILTGSGGPFLSYEGHLSEINIEQALKHPRWQMGRKITIDSATLMNKGLEVIEAHHLFGVPFNKIQFLIHPQAIIHSLVEFCDGSVIGLLSQPDMRLSIQYALTYPHRYTTGIKLLELNKVRHLDFFPPDYKRFPCLSLALSAGRQGHSFPTVLNAANEVAVQSFLENKIKFTKIPEIIENTLNKHKIIKNPSLEDILAVDNWARQIAKEMIMDIT